MTTSEDSDPGSEWRVVLGHSSAMSVEWREEGAREAGDVNRQIRWSVRGRDLSRT